MQEKIDKPYADGYDRGVNEGTNEGFKLGVAVMFMFVVPVVIISILDLTGWEELLTVSIFYFPTLIWLIFRNKK